MPSSRFFFFGVEKLVGGTKLRRNPAIRGNQTKKPLSLVFDSYSHVDNFNAIKKKKEIKTVCQNKLLEK